MSVETWGSNPRQLLLCADDLFVLIVGNNIFYEFGKGFLVEGFWLKCVGLLYFVGRKVNVFECSGSWMGFGLVIERHEALVLWSSSHSGLVFGFRRRRWRSFLTGISLKIWHFELFSLCHSKVWLGPYHVLSNQLFRELLCWSHRSRYHLLLSTAGSKLDISI